MLKIKVTDPPIARIDDADYVKAINDFLCNSSPSFRRVYSETQAPLKESLLFLAGALGYISTEMITGIFSKANLPSIRTKLNELINEGLLKSIKSSTVDRYSDSLINSLYFATPKGVRILQEKYVNIDFYSAGEKRNGALHDYYNGYLKLAAMFFGTRFAVYTEYKDGMYSKANYYGISYFTDNLRVDTILNSGSQVCFAETDTGTETINVLIDKFRNYYKHMDHMKRDFQSQRSIIAQFG